MAIVEQKHGQWQAHLRGMLAECRCETTRYLLYPATYLDSVATAVHLTRLHPNQLVVMKPSLRKVVMRFQRRAVQLGVVEVLPRIAHARHMRRMQPAHAAHPGPQPPAYHPDWQ